MIGWKDKIKTRPAPPADLGKTSRAPVIAGQFGFVGTMRVASNRGWQPVDLIEPGDKVLTFDNNMQKVVDVQRELLVLPDAPTETVTFPLLVPPGALHNRGEFWLLPEQGMLIESDQVVDRLGDPFVVVPAAALDGLCGIRPAHPGGGLEITTLVFARDQVIYVEGGLLAHCPDTRPARPGILRKPSVYEVLDLADARQHVADMIAEQDGDALFCDPGEFLAAFVHPASGPHQDNTIRS